MEKLYLDQIKQVIERKTGNKYVWVKGSTFTQNCDVITLDGECAALLLDSDNIKDVRVIYDEHDGEYEYKYYTEESEASDVDYVVFLWGEEYSEDENGLFMTKQGALNGVLCIDGVDVTVEEVVEG